MVVEDPVTLGFSFLGGPMSKKWIETADIVDEYFDDPDQMMLGFKDSGFLYSLFVTRVVLPKIVLTRS